MGTKVYFNPNWNPSESYKKIKAACLIYDQVLVWSPNQEWIERSGLDSGTFLELCLGTARYAPAIQPVFRDSWTNLDHLSKSVSGLTSQEKSFHKRIVDIAETGQNNDQKLIVPSSLYETGYKLSDNIYGRGTDDPIISEIGSHFNPVFANNIQEVCAREKRAFGWGVLNVYAQDILAFRHVGANSPLASRSTLEGYKFFTESEAISRAEIPVGSAAIDLTEGDFWLNKIIDVDSMSVTEIFEFREHFLPLCAQFAAKVGRDRMLSLHEKEFENRLKSAIEGDIRTADRYIMGGSAASIVTTIAAIFGLGASFVTALLSLGPLGVLIALMLLGNYRATLTLKVARVLNIRQPGRYQLLESDFATDAVLKYTGKFAI